MTFRYAAYGALFGLVFPVFATLGATLLHGMPLAARSLLWVQTNDPLLWVINTAPFFLGALAGLAGRRQDQLIRLNESLNRRVEERDQALGKIQSLQADLEQRVAERTRDLVKERVLATSILDTVHALVVMLNQEGGIVRFNQACEQATGCGIDQAANKSFLDIFVPEDERGKENAGLDKLLAGEESNKVEMHFVTGEGARRVISWSSARLAYGQGMEDHIVATGIDITKRYQAREALRISEEHYRSLFEGMPIGLYRTTASGKILDVNTALARMLGYPDREALLAVGADRVYVNPEDRARWEQMMLRSWVVKDFEAQFRRLDGTIIWTRDNARIVPDREGKMMCYEGSLEDITEHRQALHTLRESEERIRKISESAHDAILMMDSEGNISFWNRAAERIFGYSQQEALGSNLHQLLAPARFHAAHEDAFGLFQQTGTGPVVGKTLEMTGLKHDGSEFPVELSLSAMKAGDRWNAIGIIRDITERAKAAEELARAREQAEAANEAKGTFLASMSHEIRTPLNAILGMTSLLLDTQLDDQQLDYVETTRVSGDILLTVINDILDFSKIEADKLTLEECPFSLRSCVEDALDLVTTQAADKPLDLAYIISEHLPQTFVGDVTRIRQILVNLLGNAVKFTERGEVVVSVTGQLRDRQDYLIHFSVKDTGIGVPLERQERLFRSFSQVDASTTRKYGGSGLGLVISKRLSELMGGTTWMESSGIPGEGSTFHFTVLAHAAADEAEPTWFGDQLSLEGKRALIVDDNATNRRILAHYAESWKMEPTVMATGSEALALLRQGESFDIAILDMQMPGMDGLTLARTIHRELAPVVLPLIMLTSMGTQGRDTDGVHPAAYLTKPIKPSQLLDVLSNVLMQQSTKVRKPVPKAGFDRELGRRHPLRILLAEDNVVNQKVALGLLERMGYRADVAANGLEVLESLLRQPYDVVLMDLHMPEMGGEEATKTIRQQWPVGQGPRIIAMTANALEGDREYCLAIGMDDYVSKPVKLRELVRALTESQPVGSEEDKDEPSSGTATLDFSVLQEFEAIMGADGPALVEELVELYVKDSPKLMTTMRQDIDENQARALERAAHTLKGNSDTVGARELSMLCYHLQTLAETGSLEGAEALLPQIEREFNLARQQLEFRSQAGKI